MIKYYAQIPSRKILLNGAMYTLVKDDETALAEARKRYGDDLIRVSRVENTIIFQTKPTKYWS